VSDFSQLAPADQEAIGKRLLTLLKAFDKRDAEPLLGVYSDNADWGPVQGSELQLWRACRSAGDQLPGADPEVVLVPAHLRGGRDWSAAERWTGTTSRCVPCNVSTMDRG
jgi:hypothetical protein